MMYRLKSRQLSATNTVSTRIACSLVSVANKTIEITVIRSSRNAMNWYRSKIRSDDVSRAVGRFERRAKHSDEGNNFTPSRGLGRDRPTVHVTPVYHRALPDGGGDTVPVVDASATLLHRHRDRPRSLGTRARDGYGVFFIGLHVLVENRRNDRAGHLTVNGVSRVFGERYRADTYGPVTSRVRRRVVSSRRTWHMLRTEVHRIRTRRVWVRNEYDNYVTRSNNVRVLCSSRKMSLHERVDNIIYIIRFIFFFFFYCSVFIMKNSHLFWYIYQFFEIIRFGGLYSTSGCINFWNNIHNWIRIKWWK